jgi:hypothetical protein
MSAIAVHKYLEKSFSYPQYRALIDTLLVEGKTTGTNHSADFINYTQLNVHRMERLDKTIVLNGDLLVALHRLKRKQIWLVITEAWCGDAAQNLPILHLIAAQTPNIELHLVLRDEHLELMDQYLTNGSRSIPKLIMLDAETLTELATWGPRPAGAQELLAAHKANPTESHADFVKNVQLWYAKDKTLSTQHELLALLKSID